MFGGEKRSLVVCLVAAGGGGGGRKVGLKWGKMVCGAAVRRGSLFVLVLYLGFGSTPCTARVYTNHWALRIAGGPDAADRIAEKYGYRNMGQVSHWK